MATSFTFFISYYEALKYLSDEDCGQMLKAICEYALEGKEPIVSNPILKGYWTLIRPTLDRSIMRSEAGRRGGKNGAGVSRNIGNINASKSIANTEQPASKSKEDKDSIVGVGEDKESKGKRSKSGGRFTPPTVEDVRTYCSNRGNDINAQHFVDFYTARGWKYGSTAIKDWKACVRTWEQRNGFDPQRKKTTSAKLGLGEYIDNEGNRRYSDNLPSVPMSAPPRPSKDCVWSKETNSWIPAGL